MPRLPILTTANVHTEASWHAYIFKVYHQHLSTGMVVDLNTFSWFYQDEPAVRALLRDTSCLAVCVVGVSERTYEGTPWTGPFGPEDVNGAGGGVYVGGFFVARPFLLPNAADHAIDCINLEVMHVYTQWAGAEAGVSWFFHTVGSGVYLDCTALPSTGRVVGYAKRSDLDWPGDGAATLANYMDTQGYSMLIVTEADYSNIYFQPAGTTNPRTEIIVRQHQAAPPSDYFGGQPEDTLPSRSCLTDAAMGFHFNTGIGGTLPCNCEPREYLNCDATT